MKNSLKRLLQIAQTLLPHTIQKIILRMHYYLKSPKLISALNDYIETDERQKFIHILEAINYINVAGVGGETIPQVYFEFGCHSGRTFSAAVNAAAYFSMNNAKFYAFDSFEGLPQTDSKDDGFFQTGTFCTSRNDFIKIVRQKTGVHLADEYIVQGYYCDSLTNELQAKIPKAGVIHIDVDLYSSTVDVLNFIKPLMVVGTLLIFDDWYCFPPEANMGEMRAVKEFCERNPSFKLQEWKAYSTFGQSFFVTALP